MKSLEDAYKVELKIQNMTEQIKSDIYKTILHANQTEEGYVTNNIRMVSVSNLNGMILSPSYYTASAQAQSVSDRLQNATTATELMNRIKEMVRQKKSNQTWLNESTIAVLETYLPQASN